jgi:hypothetical protein
MGTTVAQAVPLASTMKGRLMAPQYAKIVPQAHITSMSGKRNATHATITVLRAHSTLDVAALARDHASPAQVGNSKPWQVLPRVPCVTAESSKQNPVPQTVPLAQHTHSRVKAALMHAIHATTCVLVDNTTLHVVALTLAHALPASWATTERL